MVGGRPRNRRLASTPSRGQTAVPSSQDPGATAGSISVPRWYRALCSAVSQRRGQKQNSRGSRATTGPASLLSTNRCQSRRKVMYWRKGRASHSSPRHGCDPITVAPPTSRRAGGRSGCASTSLPSCGKFGGDRVRLIAFLAMQGRTLREIAAKSPPHTKRCGA